MTDRLDLKAIKDRLRDVELTAGRLECGALREEVERLARDRDSWKTLADRTNERCDELRAEVERLRPFELSPEEANTLHSAYWTGNQKTLDEVVPIISRITKAALSESEEQAG